MYKKLFLTLLTLTLLLVSCTQPDTQTGAATPAIETPTQTKTAEPIAEDKNEPTDETGTYNHTFEAGSCPFEVPASAEDLVECGYVVVPEDHSDPDSPTIRLAVAVIKDLSEGHLPDPVMLLSGGPGEKMVHNAIAMAEGLAPIHPNRDFIVFDQRGVGLSEPALECPEFMGALLDLLDEPDPDIALKTQFDAWMACRDRLGSLAGHPFHGWSGIAASVRHGRSLVSCRGQVQWLVELPCRTTGIQFAETTRQAGGESSRT